MEKQNKQIDKIKDQKKGCRIHTHTHTCLSVLVRTLGTEVPAGTTLSELGTDKRLSPKMC